MRTENVFGRDHSNLCPVLAQAVYNSRLSCLHYIVLHTAGILLVPSAAGDGGFAVKYAQSRQLMVHHNSVESSLIQIIIFPENPEQLFW